MRSEVRQVDWYAQACGRARARGRLRNNGQGSTGWPEFTPPVALSDGPLGAVQAADREIARQTARRARAVAEFAASRPAVDDRSQGEPGAMSAERWAARPESLRPVSEWASRELVVALSISAVAADALLARSLDLVHRLPGTLAALEAGALHPGHLWTMLEKVAPIEDPAIRADVEAQLLRWAAGRVVTPAQLGAKARREVARRDVRAAARQLQKALEERGVHLSPHDVDGMATVTVVATTPEAHALYRALVACAGTLDADGDPRTRGQKMVDCLLDLVLRPGETELPPVQVLLTVVASIATLAGGDAPGEIDGHVVPAEMVRQFLEALTASSAQTSSPAGGTRGQHADPVPWQEREQEELSKWWGEMERRVLSGELVDPDPERAPSRTSEFADGAPPRLVRQDDRQTEPPGVHGVDRSGDHGPDHSGGHGPDYSGGYGVDRSGGHGMDHSGGHGPDHSGGHGVDRSGGHGMDRSGDHGSEPPVGDPPAVSGSPPPEWLLDEPPPWPPGAQPGWWTSADRAVDEAGKALSRARRALDRAERMVRTASAADAADEDTWQAGVGRRLTDAEDAVAALRSANDAGRQRVLDLLATTGGGTMLERPRIALTDALSGTLLALTDLPGLRRAGRCDRTSCVRRPGCRHDLAGRPGLGPPGPTNGYRPSAELDRWLRARDRRCRFPGCRRRVPRGGELDHDRPFPAGPTSAGNLVGYCTADHRGKHQAPGWTHRLEPDGTLTVTTPTGLVAVTSPPPY